MHAAYYCCGDLNLKGGTRVERAGVGGLTTLYWLPCCIFVFRQDVDFIQSPEPFVNVHVQHAILAQKLILGRTAYFYIQQ